MAVDGYGLTAWSLQPLGRSLLFAQE